MKLTSWEEIEAEQLSDKVARRVLHGQNATVARFFLAKGAITARHEHESEQYSAVLSGVIKMIFDNREVVLRPGDVLLISPHEAHAAEALEDTMVQDIFAPRRDDWIRKDDAYLRK